MSRTFRVEFRNDAGEFVRCIIVRASSNAQAIERAESEHLAKFDCILNASLPAIYGASARTQGARDE